MQIIRVLLERRRSLGADGYDVAARVAVALNALGEAVRHVSPSRVEPGAVELAVFTAPVVGAAELVHRTAAAARPWGWVLSGRDDDTDW